MYHFLSGYTAKVAGTEAGVEANRRRPSRPASARRSCRAIRRSMPSMLGDMIAHSTAPQCWLVNTGWTGGAYGVGQRIKIAHTRAMLRAALDGQLTTVIRGQGPEFRYERADHCPEVPTEVLDPRATWSDKKAYDQTARASRPAFRRQFRQFESHVDDRVKSRRHPRCRLGLAFPAFPALPAEWENRPTTAHTRPGLTGFT